MNNRISMLTKNVYQYTTVKSCAYFFSFCSKLDSVELITFSYKTDRQFTLKFSMYN